MGWTAALRKAGQRRCEDLGTQLAIGDELTVGRGAALRWGRRVASCNAEMGKEDGVQRRWLNSWWQAGDIKGGAKAERDDGLMMVVGGLGL